MVDHGLGVLARPFVWCFQTPGGRYVYDVNSNGFFRVAAVVYDVLAAAAREGTACAAELAERHGPAAVAAACREIRAQQDRGIFLPTRPLALRLKMGRPEIEARLKNGLRMLTLCLTEFCNLRCDCCVYGGGFSEFRRHSVRRMAWDTARRAMDLFLNSAAEVHDEARRDAGTR